MVPSLDGTSVRPSHVQDNFGEGPSNWQDNLVGHGGSEPSILCDETSARTTPYDIPNEDVPEPSEVAMTDDDSIMHDMVLEEEVVNEPIKMGKWKEWIPMFYPVYEEPSFPLPELSTKTILYLCDEMDPKDQAPFLLSNNSVAQRPNVKAKLYQLKREHRLCFKLLGEWAYYIRWIQIERLPKRCPKEKTGSTVHTSIG